MMKIKKFNKGFSLVELMVAMAISSLVLSGIYTLFHKQVATHNTERLMVSMQQNARAVSDGENITYALDNDADGNGIADGTPCNLVRIINVAGATQTDVVARNIDALNFDYFDTSVTPVNPLIDDTFTPWQVPAGQIVDIRSIRVSIVARSGATIPALFIGYTDSTVYRNRPRDTDGDGIPDTADTILPPQNDNFRRMQVTTEIDCRN
jgi:type IV pilus assembly protein PilW